MPPNLPILRPRPGLLATRHDRDIAKRVGEIQGELFVERARDVARRDLAKGRMSDIHDVTDHALSEGLGIMEDYKANNDAAPFVNDALRGIAEDGMLGIRQISRRFSRED
jgi:hypothetical protein